MKRMCSLLAKFNYENKEYFIVQIGKNKIDYVIKEDDKFTTEIGTYDFEIIRCVYNALKIDREKSINLGLKKIDGKKFEIFYDRNTKLYYWYKIENNTLKEADYSENCKLNFQYNNIPLVLYQGLSNNKTQESTKKQDFIQRIVKNGQKTIFVLVAAGISLTSFTQCEARQLKNQDKLNLVEDTNIVENVELSTQSDKGYDYNKIKTAIEQNQNLGKEEKEFLYKLKFIIDENYKYMNLDLIEERLRNLKIVYHTEKDSNSNGKFCPSSDEIHLYETEDFKTSNKNVILHEILHTFQDINCNRFTMEFSDEIAAREYLRRMGEMGLIETTEFKNEYGSYTKYAGGYNIYVYAQYMLSELLTQEQIQAYQWSTDEGILLNRLMEIDGKAKNEEEQKEITNRAWELLETIDELRKWNSETEQYEYVDEYNLYIEKYNSIYNQMNYYYKKLKGKSMDETLGIGLWDYDSDNCCSIYGFSVGVRLEQSIYDEEVEKIPLYSSDRKIAQIKTLEKFSNYDSNIKYGNVMSKLYYLPKTYFSNVRKNPIVYVDPEKCENYAIEINEEVENFYKKQLELERKKEDRHKDEEER